MFYSIIGSLNDYVFERFLCLHHFVANYVKNVDERGRNIMCAHLVLLQKQIIEDLLSR